MKIQLEDRHLKIVKEILSELAVQVSVFGSRAKGTAKRFSDLDLVVMGEIDRTTLRKLTEQFEESDLPFKVDIVVWDKIDSNFQDHIRNDLISI